MRHHKMNEIQWQTMWVEWGFVKQIQLLGGSGGDGGGSAGGDAGATGDTGTADTGQASADAAAAQAAADAAAQGVTGNAATGGPGGFNAGDAFGVSTGPGAVAASASDAGPTGFDTGVSFGAPTSSAPDQGITGTAATEGTGFGAGFGSPGSTDTGIGIGTDAFGQTAGPGATTGVSAAGAPEGFGFGGMTGGLSAQAGLGDIQGGPGGLAGQLGFNDIGQNLDAPTTFGANQTATHGAFDPTSGIGIETAPNPNFAFNFNDLDQPQTPNAPPFNTNAAPINLGQFNQTMSQLAGLPQTAPGALNPGFFNNQGQLTTAGLAELEQGFTPNQGGLPFSTAQLGQMFGGGAMPTFSGTNPNSNVLGQALVDNQSNPNFSQQAATTFAGFPNTASSLGGAPITSVAGIPASQAFTGADLASNAPGILGGATPGATPVSTTSVTAANPANTAPSINEIGGAFPGTGKDSGPPGLTAAQISGLFGDQAPSTPAPTAVASNAPSFGGGATPSAPSALSGGVQNAGLTGGQTDPGEGLGSSFGNGSGDGLGTSLGGGGGGEFGGGRPNSQGVSANPAAGPAGIGIDPNGVWTRQGALSSLISMLQGNTPTQNLSSQNSQILAQLGASPQATGPQGFQGGAPPIATAQTASLGGKA